MLFSPASSGLVPFQFRGALKASGGGGVSTAFITSSPSTRTIRSDFAGFLGFQFTVGTSGISITDIGMWDIAGVSSGTLDLYILDSDGNTSMGSVTVSVSGTNNWVFATLGTPVSLASGKVAYCMVNDVPSYFYDNESYANTGVATNNGACFSRPASGPFSPGTIWGPVNFKYL